MFNRVATTPRRLDDYRPYAGEAAIAELRALARPLQGRRILHVNATAYGGGVAELLSTLVPLLQDLGLAAEWQVVPGDDAFFTVTKALHNALQGAPLTITPAMQAIWREANARFARLFDERYDIVVVHDPQPAGLPFFLQEQGRREMAARWVWRCHIDLTAATPAAWAFLRPYLGAYDAAIFTMSAYVKPDLPIRRVVIAPPAIDPLSPKNIDLETPEVIDVLQRFGLDPGRPLLVQVSRFDPWKDPLGVIDVYRMVRREVSGLQLALVGAMAADDPEGFTWYEKTARHAGDDPDIFLLTNLHGVGPREVNAFQRAARVVLQKSLREGFGLTVSEALWKGRPVVGGRVGGIPLQIIDGQTGYLVSGLLECAWRTFDLLRHPEEADRMGQRGREHVRRHFLITRYLGDYLRLFADLLTSPTPA